jgi:hypothetical protein
MGHGTRARDQRGGARPRRRLARPFRQSEIPSDSLPGSAVSIAACDSRMVPTGPVFSRSWGADPKGNRRRKIRRKSFARRFRGGGCTKRSEPACACRLASCERLRRARPQANLIAKKRSGGDLSITAARSVNPICYWLFIALCISSRALRMSSRACFIASSFCCCAGVRIGRTCAMVLSRIAVIFCFASCRAAMI